MNKNMTTSISRDGTFNNNLIREVRRNPIIYDSHHPLHGNAAKKHQTWLEIAANLNEKVGAVKTRWRTLRDRYTKERRRVLMCGVGSSFSYYADLCFLDNAFMNNRLERNLPLKRKRNNENKASNSEVHCDLAATMFSKPETLGVACSLASRIGDDLLINPEGIVASSGQGRSLLEKDGRCQVNKESPTSSVNSVTETTLTMVKVAESMVCDNSDAGKCKLDSVSDSSSDVIAQALMRSAEALQRLAERKSLFDRATSLHDADECFADFVCSSLKSIDNSSRVHARIAILHALAQFQK